MIQQKLSLFQSLNSSPSRAVGMEEVVRYIHYDNDVKQKTESYRQMASVLGKAKADEEVKRRLVRLAPSACCSTAMGAVRPMCWGSRGWHWWI